MLRRLAPFALAACAALALPRASRAQDLAPATTGTAAAQPAPAVTPAGPTMENATVTLKRPSTEQQSTKAPVVVARRGGGDQPTALMIVGGAAFLAGAIIGGDAGTIIMVGGAGVGLYGLYLYLQ